MELKAFKPSFVVCCVSDLALFFGTDEDNIKELNGKIIYCKEYDCFVMFSVSPQYAYYQDNITHLFIENIKKIKNFL
jgi:hypothetical protein